MLKKTMHFSLKEQLNICQFYIFGGEIEIMRKLSLR